ncbi:hypothetical protein D3C80_1898820 [compost metagenome]
MQRRSPDVHRTVIFGQNGRIIPRSIHAHNELEPEFLSEIKESRIMNLSLVPYTLQYSLDLRREIGRL